MKTSTKSDLYLAIENQKHRSAWDKGVNEYALELVEFLEDNDLPVTKEAMLNGASCWEQASYGGSHLIYNGDIAERLCSPSELKKCKYGENRPNCQEDWLDVQTRALHQACDRVLLANKGL